MSNELKIKNEDWLYETIWRLVEIDRTNFLLIQFIRFEFVSTSIDQRFTGDGVCIAGLIDLSIEWMLVLDFFTKFQPANRLADF
jgi:hypothetical protein